MLAPLPQLNLEEAILRRTVHLTNIPEALSEEALREFLSSFGEITAMRVDTPSGGQGLMALIQFSDESAALALLNSHLLKLSGAFLRVSPSRITIDVIPPIDAVFGKPMTVGNHVMAINPSRASGRLAGKTRDVMHKVDRAAYEVLQGISKRTGWQIPQEELERFLKDTPDHSRKRSRSSSFRRRSRSGSRRNETDDNRRGRWR
jgi:hypothetical protein